MDYTAIWANGGRRNPVATGGVVYLLYKYQLELHSHRPCQASNGACEGDVCE